MQRLKRILVIFLLLPTLILMQDLSKEATTSNPLTGSGEAGNPSESKELPGGGATTTVGIDSGEAELTTNNGITTAQPNSGEDSKPTTLPADSSETQTESVSAEEQIKTTANPSSNEEIESTTTATPQSSTTTTIQTPGTCTCECPTMQTTASPEETAAPVSAEEEVEVSGLPACTEVGNFPHPSDCQKYYNCAGGPADFVQSEEICPPKNVFSPTLARCTRDVSSCSDVVCTQAGNIPDPASNASYYWCVDNGSGQFHIFHVQCEKYEVYIPQIAKCFVDLQYLQDYTANIALGVLTDRDVVKAEVKLFKEEAKAKLKEEKLRQKVLEKAKKAEEKLAQKELKRKQKLADKETPEFICTGEGNFPVENDPGSYNACISKKGKWKRVSMKCPLGQSFDPQQAVCSAGNA